MKFGEQDIVCESCDAQQIHYINGKTSDLCQVIYPDGRDHDGYVPTDLPGGVHGDYGDYIVFAWCGDCGQIQQELERD